MGVMGVMGVVVALISSLRPQWLGHFRTRQVVIVGAILGALVPVEMLVSMRLQAGGWEYIWRQLHWFYGPSLSLSSFAWLAAAICAVKSNPGAAATSRYAVPDVATTTDRPGFESTA